MTDILDSPDEEEVYGRGTEEGTVTVLGNVDPAFVSNNHDVKLENYYY